MVKNDIVTLKITGMTSEGAGVGRADSTAVFVRGSAVGDTVEAVIIKVTKNYAIGKLLRVIEPSEHRVENTCGSYPQCGGCVYRHISYSEECRIKRERVADCLRRIGGIDVAVDECEFGRGERLPKQSAVPRGNERKRIQHRFFCATQPPYN